MKKYRWWNDAISRFITEYYGQRWSFQLYYQDFKHMWS